VKRWWLVIALLLSLGVNVGILATLALSGGGDRAAVEEGPRSDLPRPGRPHGGPPGAGPSRGPGAGRPPLPEIAERRLERLAGELGLAGAERERFLEIQRGLLADGARLARERFRLQAELRRELLADEPDRERIGRLIGEIAAVFTRLEESTATAILDSRELLDPEQERRYLEVASRIRPRLLRQAEQTMGRRFAERRRRAAPPQP
jgi:hypothetical protein